VGKLGLGWKRRFFLQVPGSEHEVSYFKNADMSDKQGGIDLRHVHSVSIQDTGSGGGDDRELHVQMRTEGGRVYVLKPCKGSEKDLDRYARLFRAWSQRFGGEAASTSSSSLHYSAASVGNSASASAATATAGTSPTGAGGLRASSQLALGNVGTTGTVSAASGASMAAAAAGGGGGGGGTSSPTSVTASFGNTSPRKLMLASARERFGTAVMEGTRPAATSGGASTGSSTSSSHLSGVLATGPRLDDSPRSVSAPDEVHRGWMIFSLLESLRPSMRLFFVLYTKRLVGYGDETLTEKVEHVNLDAVEFIVERLEGTDEHSCLFKLYAADEKQDVFLCCDTVAEKRKWIALLRTLCPEEEVKPEFGCYDMNWDVAEEVDVGAITKERAGTGVGDAFGAGVVGGGGVIGSTPVSGGSAAGGSGAGGGGAVGFLQFVETQAKRPSGGAAGFLEYFENHGGAAAEEEHHQQQTSAPPEVATPPSPHKGKTGTFLGRLTKVASIPLGRAASSEEMPAAAASSSTRKPSPRPLPAVPVSPRTQSKGE
jgi:hypothetical protein